MIGGGTVVNAVAREAWFSVDLRSLDTPTQAKLEQAVEARRGTRPSRKASPSTWKNPSAGLLEGAAEGGTAQPSAGADGARRQQSLPQAGTPAIVPADVGSTDANNAVALGIPAVAIGATLEHMPHRLEETAEAGSIVPGIKSLMTLAVTLTSHQ
jgi:Acetylornithine deacetylase/Succinyl-diaminopimelate desuccinylase and related deacylases